MRTGWLLLGWLALSAADGGKGGGRAFILDTRDGHVWIWSENEPIATADGRRGDGAGFIYQGRLRPGSQPGELIERRPGKRPGLGGRSLRQGATGRGLGTHRTIRL